MTDTEGKKMSRTEPTDQADGHDDREDDASPPTKTNAGSEATVGSRASRDPDVASPPNRDREHVSGYGGEGGKPKSSSDTREPDRPD
jgi:hypothetical protein